MGPELNRLREYAAPRRGWWLAAAAAAAVVAIIVGLQVGDRGPGVAPPATVDRSAPVPWAPLPATSPRIPTFTVPPVPDPAPAEAAPPCRASDLRARSDGPDGAGGPVYLNVDITSTGRSCRLAGFPTIQPLDHGQLVDVPVRRSSGELVYRHPVLVTGRSVAVLSLSWSSAWCTTPVHNDTIRAVLPAGGGSLTFPGYGRDPGCNATPGGGPTPILVSSFQPQKWHRSDVRSAYASVHQTWDAPRTATAGDTIHFTVTLTSKRRLVLDPCPDYTVAVYGPHQPGERTFALNCLAVPFKDSRGHPYLPAGRPVHFAMQAKVGSPGPTKFLWQLKTPDNTLHLGDQLIVKPTASPVD